MGEALLGGAIKAGTATAIGSLPHHDAHAAAALTLRCLPELPAAPQLPLRSRREGVVAQWAAAVPGLTVHDDGVIEVTSAVEPMGRLKTLFDDTTHAGLLTFLEVAKRQPRPPQHIKVQTAGPLTLGVAFVEAGMDAALAFALGARVARAWAAAIAELVDARAFRARAWSASSTSPRSCVGRVPKARSTARSRLICCRAALAACRDVSGVHVCGNGDLRLALDAGPQVVHFDVDALESRRRRPRSHASSTAGGGSRGARSRPIARSENTRSRCGRRCSRRGVS